MKRLAFSFTLLSALAAFMAPNAEAQFCFKWVGFCDGIQVNSIVNNHIDAEWYNFECATNLPLTGGREGEAPIINLCPGRPGNGVIECYNCQFGPSRFWHIVIDVPLDGTLDVVDGMYQQAGDCYLDELAYVIQLGACTALQGHQMRSRSSIE